MMVVEGTVGSSARHIRCLEVILVLDKVHFAERIHHFVEALELRQDLDIAVHKVLPAWEAVETCTVGSGRLASMRCCNAVAASEAIGD